MNNMESKYTGEIKSQTASTTGITSKSKLNITSKATLDITSKTELNVTSSAKSVSEIEALAGAFSACKIDNWKDLLYNRE